MDTAIRNRELLDLVNRHCSQDGVFKTAFERLTLVRSTTPNMVHHGVHEASVCMILQGAKKAMVGQEVYHYDASKYLIVSVDMPASGCVTEASIEKPYLGLKLTLDQQSLSSMLLELNIQPPAMRGTTSGVVVNEINQRLLDATLRLVSLLDGQPEDLNYLAPLAEREMLYWLAQGQSAAMLMQIAQQDSRLRRISSAIAHLREGFRKPFDIEELLNLTSMSSAAFFQHFKAVTNMTPLQFQKQLRLQEARSLMFSRQCDIAQAGHQVGYESPSQFSREYARMFGLPPSKDIEHWRAQGMALES
ncbi:AraC family transcriptional regulator [Pokkaliibacter sp. CJK22405]|uniref:AraC family transcriptional regulator n=1 Tax=Pokkaliibacter sp. CJK22405 TaxID=3384615 RepID=UPI003984F0E2